MDLIVTGIAAGVLGTLVMDIFNHLLARAGIILRIDVGMIGRMFAGWVHGRFLYRSPSEMKQVANELLYGYFTHYTIGVGLAIPFVFGWGIFIGGPVSPVWALTYGVATTVASVFFVYPSMGLGVFGWRSPEGIKAPLSSLANHFFLAFYVWADPGIHLLFGKIKKVWRFSIPYAFITVTKKTGCKYYCISAFKNTLSI